MKRKICVVVTARPSYSRIRTALHAIKADPNLELQLVAAASTLLDQYGNAIKYMEQDGFDISSKVYMVVEGENLTTMAKTTGLGLLELATTFDNLKPDLVVTIADRYETIATAIAAAYMNIPLVHIQGGEITGTIDEKVRHAVTKLADIHLVSTQKAAENVIRMGERPDAVFITGCPSIDLAANVLKNPSIDFDPFEKYKGVGATFDVKNKDYLVVMQHPVTTEYERARAQILETLYAVKEIGLPTFWFWPNVDAGSDGTSKGIRMFRENERPENIHFFKNMDSQDFLRLVYNSRCIVGNSSVGIRETSFLGVPSVNIGTREAGRERGGNVLDVDYDRVQIREAIRKQVANGRYPSDPLYGKGDAGQQIAKILAEVPLRSEKRLAYS
ncbi:MAG: UDP-N-acetylglucosamine 2-epimerase (hydrolyzing) [Chloroflexi bacterium CFX1]|nr:UDP-N-acetylglucosamine 2-epimerase (hydrolyzing) [Chloroflexi bacterium CFX1]MCQ3954064.1 UDP-N-acetylglucosamine 2-epimerase (hydrolyzing) [Chloroflexota bacterium]MDL1918178.1 UDP-N-acetylglucosamine 2-epimerase (hydrolyzing) [Chloroflexi bacterium CFX5]NUQ60364.1 UDP-N-acetylglucosamine 2-epimerase (hydrolyzing) [Anaerolineales bacterium]